MITIYTQNGCVWCSVLKENLKTWCVGFTEINISENAEFKQFLKERNHTTVPQLYVKNFNINAGIDTIDFTEQCLYDRLDEFIKTQTPEEISELLERTYESEPI